MTRPPPPHQPPANESGNARSDSPADLSFADLLLFFFSVGIGPVYYDLYKAAAFLLGDLPSLRAYVRDLYELPELPELSGTTDFEAIKAQHYLAEPVLNPRRLLPRGGVPQLAGPHFRGSLESTEILRMFNGAFGDLAGRSVDLYPEGFREEIDRLGALSYQHINHGAYKAGFARTQGAYERAAARYFAALDWLEERLPDPPWLAGTEQSSEADLRLFPTVYRHDSVYFTRFNLNERRISDYPHLAAWLKRMLAVPGVAESSNMDHARNGYFGRTGNEVVPAGPLPLELTRSAFPEGIWLSDN